MPVTRIKNNQITTASGNTADGTGINAAVKVQNYTITSGKLANSLVYGSDLTVTGNLTVQGTTTTIDTVNTLIQDPLITLADGQTSGTPTVDIGLIGLRGNQNSSFIGWKESSATFVAALSNTTVSNTTVNITSYANFAASTITAQGNLSVVGNIVGTANFTGTLTAGNVLTPGVVSAVGNVTGGNVLTAGIMSSAGNAIHGNVLTAGLISATSTITSAANITGANILTSGVVSAAGNIIANASSFFIGNGSQLTGVAASSAGFPVSSGNTSLSAPVAGGNISVNVGGTSNVAVFATTGEYVTGVVSATGNITGGNILTAGLVSATGNVTTAGALNGATLSLSGNVTSALNVTGNVAAGNFTTPGLLSVTGNATAGNISTAGLVSATGNVTTNGALNGATLSLSGNVTSALNVTANVAGGNITTPGLISATGNLTSGNVYSVGLVTATGNVTGGNILTAGLISAGGNITTATNINTPNVVATGNLSLSGGNILLTPTSGNVVLPGAATTYINNLAQPVNNNDAASKIYVDNLVTTQIAYHQPVVAATVSNLATATGGTITYNNGANGIGANITTTGSFNLIDTANVQTANTRILVKNEGNLALNGIYQWSNATVITRTLDADTYGPNSTTDLSINDYFFVQSGNVNKGSAFVVDSPVGVITFGTSNIQFAQFSSSQTYSGGNGISLYGTVISTVYDNNTIGVNGSNQLYIPPNASLTTPNIGAATGTSLSATGTVTAATLSSTGNTIAGNVTTVGLVSSTGNITGGNVLTAGLMSSTGNAIHGNVLTAGLLSATGNVTGGNFLTSGIISSTGNILSAGNLVISGAYLDTGDALISSTAANANVALTPTGTGIVQLNSAASATGNVTTAGALNGATLSLSGNVTSALNITGNVTSGNVLSPGIMSSAGNAIHGNVSTAGLITATGNVTGGNLLTAGLISATGTITSATTITGGNLATAGTASATGNITGGNLLTAGLISATGTITSATTITGGNLATAGTASATGNVTGGNLLTAGLISSTGTATHGNIQIGPDSINDIGTNQTIRINSSSANTNFAVNGTAANVFFVSAASNVAAFGTSTVNNNALVSFNSATSIIVPVGNTTQRTGYGTTGMIRFNTTNNTLELFNNSAWANVGAPTFTVVADEQFNGDGSNVNFTLGSTQTTNSCIVSINGIVQIPGTAYSVSGTFPSCVLTFTEAPSIGDLIDVREITTTTSVTSLVNGTGSIVIDATGNINVTGNILPTGNAVANIGSPTAQFNTIFAKATSAQYADLAEKYVADAEYAPGTVVSFGGAKEVTVSANNADRRVAGVVSTNPSYIMNGGLTAEHVATVALTGRVPTKVTGLVAKGDLMVSNGDGTARADADPQVGTVIGKALEDFAGGTGVIEVVVGRV